jgi:hypothetical protein
VSRDFDRIAKEVDIAIAIGIAAESLCFTSIVEEPT